MNDKGVCQTAPDFTGSVENTTENKSYSFISVKKIPITNRYLYHWGTYFGLARLSRLSAR